MKWILVGKLADEKIEEGLSEWDIKNVKAFVSWRIPMILVY